MAAKSVRGFAFVDEANYLAKLAYERVDRIAAGELWVDDAPLIVEQHRFAEVLPCPADDGEVERQRGFVQMDFEGVRERPTLLADRAARGFDGEVAIGEAELRVPEFGEGFNVVGGDWLFGGGWSEFRKLGYEGGLLLLLPLACRTGGG